MNDIRALMAILLFCISAYLIADLFISGFSWFILLCAIGGFLLVHVIWPRNSPYENTWYDSLEFIFDLPYRCIAMTLRGLSKVFKSGDSSIDIDL